MNFNEAWDDTLSTVSGAVRKKSFNILKRLIAEGVATDVPDNRGWRPIHESSLIDSPSANEIVEELLKHVDVDINCTTHEGETPLLLACNHPNHTIGEGIISILLNYGADPNKVDNEEESPLLVATRAGFSQAVKLLIDYNADINKCDVGGWTPLHAACTSGNIEIVRFLKNASIEVKDECGITPLFTCAQHGRFDCLKVLMGEIISRDQRYLIDEGANDDSTPLMIASQQGFTEIVDYLILSGSNPNICAKDRINALHLAAECGHPFVVLTLMKHMNITNMASLLNCELSSLTIRNPIHLAISSGQSECIDKMINNGFPIDSVDYLFENKFSITSPEPKYVTGLGLAISLNFLNMSAFLIKNNANINANSENIFSPLHCVFTIFENEYNGELNFKILQLLLNAGADVNTASHNTPNELVHSIFKLKYLKTLLQHGLDTKTFFKPGKNNINKFIILAFHNLNYEWFYRQSKEVISCIERTPLAREYFKDLGEEINRRYSRNAMVKYDQKEWSYIMQQFDSPHTLKDLSRFVIRKFLRNVCYQNTVKFVNVTAALPLPSFIRDFISYNV